MNDASLWPATEAALLTTDEMRRADALAVTAGVPGIALMEAAGAGTAALMLGRCPRSATVVLCGPGNNGGDGFVVARRLAESGWPVRVALLGARDRLAGEAAVAASRWTGLVEPLGPTCLEGASLMVDALFGAGLSRPLDGAARATVEAAAQMIAAGTLRSIAIDVPSGVNGDTGRVEGAAAPALLTATFFRRKPGHLLMPGLSLCGETVVLDIGIRDTVLTEIRPRQAAATPALWRSVLPRPGRETHKYARGHAVIYGGGRMTGAARLAARAARRVGAGLLTIACPAASFAVFAADRAGAIIEPLGEPEDFPAAVADPRHNAILVGPGAGAGEGTRTIVLAALTTGKRVVLDADALTAFAEAPERLFREVSGPTVLTPHTGEFGRLFPEETRMLSSAGKLAAARAAAARSGAVVLLKGADTVIADPDGRAAIASDGPSDLATGGTGDVLAGLVIGLLAQGMDGFSATAAAAWLQGAAARRIGAGLIAEDLPEALPLVLADLS